MDKQYLIQVRRYEMQRVNFVAIDIYVILISRRKCKFGLIYAAA